MLIYNIIIILPVLPPDNIFALNVIVYSSNCVRMVDMCNRFALSKGERLNPKFEGEICIIKLTNKDTSMDLYPCTFEGRPTQ